MFNSEKRLCAVFGVQSNYKILVLASIACENLQKNAHFCHLCAQIGWFEQIKHLISLEI